eukprot:CAMPEP_0119475450 /NCGR_PEP_ID=MMETSP1344-20130328/6339_1 /TAXON_ID=236787 /ORGANISM="Florenciella parvula, Strain CCMP2471" /LENGTH=70 /DNA_ID=CAMNT_0007508983 /DNA_START=61 /DNA_END=273 /DNA_ORIENTATION=+
MATAPEREGCIGGSERDGRLRSWCGCVRGRGGDLRWRQVGGGGGGGQVVLTLTTSTTVITFVCALVVLFM